ncbi:class I SAM-dependent methyltransferase [Anaerovorax odorimutans]|uniref:class I SAM-dependent methyltransferase n=1 Tax=Anaerovorax odorimutans TaxID=109327 RepID=UPI0004006A2C|nr:class I SAM-dependent methyltransferase [Anaerovorax odorimutans]
MEYSKLFNKNSKLYLSSRPAYPKELYNYLNSICKERGVAWDCACGNGQVAIDLIRYFNKVYATDISENQISNSIKHEGIEYYVQSSDKTNFKDNSFDLICVAQALHWFNYDTFWSEVKRVLKKDGIFAAWGYSWFNIDKEIDTLIQSEFREKIRTYWAPQNKILWDNYENINLPFKKINSPDIEMSIEWDINELFAYMQSWSATRLCIEAEGTDFYSNAYKKIKGIWGNEENKKKVKMNFCMIVGRNEY